MELDGPWEAALVYNDAATDDHIDWQPVTVPGHWRSSPAFADSNGPVRYRHHFDFHPQKNTRTWLVFNGVFYQYDAWLDDNFLGNADGYFAPHEFEISEFVNNTDEHRLIVDVNSDLARSGSAQRALMGVFGTSDAIDRTWNPGGIWRDVLVRETGPVAITQFRLLCTEAKSSHATIQIRTGLNANTTCNVTLHTTVHALGGTEPDVTFSETHQLSHGYNRLKWQVTVANPQLWWPHGFGAQPLYEVTVSATVDENDTPSDQCQRVTGFRTVNVDDFIWHINGERLYIKGANYLPTSPALGEPSASDYERDIALAQTADLNLLRMWAHVEPPEFYETADRMGMLVWQDLPLLGTYALSSRKSAANQARDITSVLGHHPSVALWCAHNAPLGETLGDATTSKDSTRVVRQQLPSWNRTILDPAVRRVLEDSDPTRPVLANSGVPPHVGGRGSDTHLFYGWDQHDFTQLESVLARIPSAARFVGAFGAQSFPSELDIETSLWPQLDWESLHEKFGADSETFAQYFHLEDYPTYDEFCLATQRYQADLVRYYVETLRRLKYRPNGGYLVSYLTDSRPAISYALTDYQRQPKLAWNALIEANRSVLAVADWPEAFYAPNTNVSLDVHVVSDKRERILDSVVNAYVFWDGGEHTWSWTGVIEADNCVKVGTMAFAAPTNTTALTFRLELSSPSHPEIAHTATYTSTVVRAES